jgi:long-subunit acyl-CoA synthetase (AMP-forming)
MSELLSAIRRHARLQPDMPALTGDTGTLTYAALAAGVDRCAKALRAAGSAVAGLQMDNGPQWVVWDLACIEAGIVCVPLPVFFSAAQIAHVIAAAGIDTIITAAGLTAVNDRAVISLPAGTAKITFTSGTTGAPKGVCLPQSGLENVARSILDTVGPECAVRHFSVMPLSILLENVAGVYSALIAGCACHINSLAAIGFENPFRPDFSRLAAQLKTCRATSAILVPELLRGLMGAMAAQQVSIPSFMFVAVGGGKVAPEILAQAHKMGIPAYEGYGLSECGSVVTLNTPQANQPGKTGRLLPHIDCAIGADGEIIIRNPAFLGYVGAPHNGPLHTGDTGSLDAQGFLSIGGRIGNVIITSYGRNISPEWPESALLAQPEIAQAVVYGEAMPSLGALIVPAARDADLEAAIARANAQLPDYARIKNFHTVEPFSAAQGLLTGNGRPKRREILQRYASITQQEKQDEILRSAG